MESLLPSEIARLVYGYLKDEGCMEAAEKFLETSVHLNECQKISKQGRRFHTRVMGRTLSDMLDVFSTVHTLVQDHLNSSQDVITNSSLLGHLQQLLSGEPTVKELISKGNEIRSITDSVLKPFATSTPYSTSGLPNGRCDEVDQDAPCTSGSGARKQLIVDGEKDKGESTVDPEALQQYMKSVNRALLDNTHIHEKLAEKINEKRTAGESLSPDTIGKNIVKEIDIENIIDEIIDSAKEYESKSKEGNIYKENNCVPLEVDTLNNVAPENTNSKNTCKIQDSVDVTYSSTVNDRLTEVNQSTAEQDNRNDTITLTNEETVIQCGNNSSDRINLNDSTKNIIEKAMISSFMSPIKRQHDLCKAKSAEDDVIIGGCSDSIPNTNAELDKESGIDNDILTKNKLQSDDQFQNSTTVVFNNLSNVTTGNFVLASPVPLLNIVGHQIINPPGLCSPGSQLKTILPSTMTNALYNGPTFPSSSVMPSNSLVLVSSQNSISSSRIYTSDRAPVAILPAPGVAANNPVLPDNSESNKVPPWRKKNSVHVRACDKVVKGRLTKITPKPSPVVLQDSIFKAGATTILPNGVAIEVLGENTINQVNTETTTENSVAAKSTDLSLETKETPNDNVLIPQSFNDSNMLVVDTSCEISVSGQSHIGVDMNEKTVNESKNVTAVGELNVESDKVSIPNSTAPSNSTEKQSSEECKKDKTPGHKQPVNKRRSMSTPRRSNHIRALDFSTPDRTVRMRKSNTSPKSTSRVKTNLKINSIVRSGLFKSPENKINSQTSSADIDSMNKKLEPQVVLDLSDDVTTVMKCETPVKCQGNKESPLNTPKITLTKPIDEITDSPMPKLAADWDAVSGLGMIVGESKCGKGMDDESVAVPQSWDAKLRSFVETNQKVATRPRRNTRRKIVVVKQVKEKKDSKAKGKKALGKGSSTSDSSKDLLDDNNKQNSKATHTSKNTNENSDVQTETKISIHDDKDDCTINNSSDDSPLCNTSNESAVLPNNNEFSSDVALKIERNILNSDASASKDSKTNLSKNEQLEKENETPIKAGDNFLIPEESLSKMKKSPGNNSFWQMPLLETPVKSNTEIVPQTPIATPLLKSIEQSTKVLLLTPNFPPTPAALREKETSLLMTPVNQLATMLPSIKDCNKNTPEKSNSLEQELIAECQRIETTNKSEQKTPMQKEMSDENETNTIVKTKPVSDPTIGKVSSKDDVKKTVDSEKPAPDKPNLKIESLDRTKSNELKKKNKDESKPVKSKPGKISEKEKKVKSEKVKKSSKEELISGFLRQAVQSVFGSSCSSSSESDNEFKQKIDKSKITDHSDEQTASNRITEILTSNDKIQITDGYKTATSLPKPKKYVKTILLSPNVQSTVKREKQISHSDMTESAKNCPEVEDKSVSNCSSVQLVADDVVSQRAILDEKLQRTIGLLKEKTIKSPRIQNKTTYSKSKMLRSKMSTVKKEKQNSHSDMTECAKNCPEEEDKSVSNCNSVQLVADDDVSQRSMLDEKLQKTIGLLKEKAKRSPRISNKTTYSKSKMLRTKKSEIVNKINKNGSSVNNTVNKPKDQNETEEQLATGDHQQIPKNVDVDANDTGGKSTKTSELKVFTVQEDNAISSPLKQFCKSAINQQESLSVAVDSQKLSPDNETTSVVENRASDTAVRKRLVLPSNEGYLHIVYNENNAKPVVNKSYNEVNNFEMTICAEDDSQDITCTLRVHPLQTLLEIFPSSQKENEPVKPRNKVVDEISCRDKSRDLNRSKDNSSSSDKHYSPRRSSKNHFPDRDLHSRGSRSNGRYSSGHHFNRSPAFRPVMSRAVKERNHHRNHRRDQYYDDRRHAFSSSRPPADRRCTSRSSSPADQKQISSRSRSSDGKTKSVKSSSDRRCRSKSFSPEIRRKRSKSSVDRRSGPSYRERSQRTVEKINKDKKTTVGRRKVKEKSPDNAGISHIKEEEGNQILKPIDKVACGTDLPSKPNMIDIRQSLRQSSSKFQSTRTLLTRKVSLPIKNRNAVKNSLLSINSPMLNDETDLEEGEIVSVCGDDNLESENVVDDLMDLAIVTSQHITRSLSKSSSLSNRVLTPKKRKLSSSEEQVHGPEKKQKPDDAQRLLKNLDSKDLEQFLSAVHSETENI